MKEGFFKSVLMIMFIYVWLGTLKQTEAATKNVSDWPEFVKAFSDTSIDLINITTDFYVPERPINLTQTDVNNGLFSYSYDLSAYLNRDNTLNSGWNTYTRLKMSGIARKITIEGNGHVLDFGSMVLDFTDTNLSGLPSEQGWDIIWQNFTMYNGNWYGFTTLDALSSANQKKSLLRYHNVVSYGNQMLHSPNTDIFLSGVTKNIQVENYTSPFRTWKSGNVDQINFHILNLTIEEDADVELYALTGGNILLRNGGMLTMKKNSKMKITGNPTGVGELDGQNTNLRIEGGCLVMEKDAILDLVPKSNYSALSLVSSGSKVEIGNGAEININSKGHTNNDNWEHRNLIYLATGANLTVAEQGKLSVTATGMGSSNSNIIHVAGNANFMVGKKGIFDIQSDSTSQNQNLLYFSYSGSSFQFSDAQTVNLQRTSTLDGAGTSNGLINIGGSGGKLLVDVQKVNMWGKNNLTDIPNKIWSPMYGMTMTYNGTTSINTNASSLVQSNINDFKTNFSTKNVQRIHFDYIPSVNVSIKSTATDLTGSADSTTVYGTTNPGAFVRLTDTPVNGTIQDVFSPSENLVPSPVTATDAYDPLYSEKFTVQADNSGNYSYTLPDGKQFSAGTIIQAYSFLNGKTDTITQTVLDATPPTGKSNTVHTAVGESIPDPAFFISTPQDSNPLLQTYRYAYSASNPSDLIMGMMQTKGTYDVDVDLVDNAGNKTTIRSSLVVHDTLNYIGGKNIEISADELRVMDAAALSDHIMAESTPTAYKIVNGVQLSLTNKIQIEDMGTLGPTSDEGDYPVRISVSGADSGLGFDIGTELSVKVVVSKVTLTVKHRDGNGYPLVDENGQIIADVVTTVNHGGSYTTSPVVVKGYGLTGNSGNTSGTVPSTGFTVTYMYKGTLMFTNIPSVIDFKDGKVIALNQTVQRKDTDLEMMIRDTRGTKGAWAVQASLKSPLKNGTGKTLINALRYIKDDGTELILSNAATTIYLNKENVSTTPVEAIITWSSGTGIVVKTKAGEVQRGSYEAEIKWVLVDAL